MMSRLGGDSIEKEDASEVVRWGIILWIQSVDEMVTSREPGFTESLRILPGGRGFKSIKDCCNV